MIAAVSKSIPYDEVQRQLLHSGKAMTKEELARMEKLEQAVLTLTSKFDNYLEDEQKLQPKLDEVLTTFEHAKGVIKFIKVLSTISAFATGLWITFYEVFKHTGK